MSEENTASEVKKSGKGGRGGSTRPKKDDSIWKEEDDDEEEPNSRYTAAVRAVQAATSEAAATVASSPSIVSEKETRAPATREMGGTPFRDAYETRSVHFIPEVWTAFKKLRPDTGKSLTKLQNEAMAWLLIKYGAMTPELRALFEEFRIEVPPSE
jgi:hypothetical protein